MSDTDERLAKLEADLKQMQDTVRPGETPALGIAGFVAFVLYVILVFKIPLPDGWSGGWRFGLGVGIVIATMFVCGMAFGLVEAAFKIMVEIAAVLVFFINGVAGVLVCSFSNELRQMIVDEGVARDKSWIVLVVVTVLALFVFDVFAFLIIYPAMKVAGTKLS